MKPCLSNYVVTLQVSCEYDYECIVGGQVLYDTEILYDSFWLEAD